MLGQGQALGITFYRNGENISNIYNLKAQLSPRQAPKGQPSPRNPHIVRARSPKRGEDGGSSYHIDNKYQDPRPEPSDRVNFPIPLTRNRDSRASKRYISRYGREIVSIDEYSRGWLFKSRGRSVCFVYRFIHRLSITNKNQTFFYSIAGGRAMVFQRARSYASSSS